MTQALVSFFVILDPLGNILVFHLLAGTAPFWRRVFAALLAVGAAFLLLVAFSLGGEEVLSHLGISGESFQVAAGLLLFPPAYRLIMEGQPAPVEQGRSQDPLDHALVPMATPMIAGPGALAATTSFTESVGRETTLAAIGLILILTLAALAASSWLFRFVGAAALRLLSRIVGIVLFAIAVDFVLDGLRDFAATNAIFQ